MSNVFYERLTNALHLNLLHNPKCKALRKYLLRRRGLSKNTIRTHKIGAFDGNLRKLAEQLGWESLVEHGIIWNASESPFKQYPIVVPINDAYGKPIAIGCRTLLSEEDRESLGIPKYRNSVYSKTSHLFGLDKAIYAIRNTRRVFVVEGYFDVLSAHQNNIMNVVATCGTIFSRRQLIVLSRYAKEIILLFDNDKPGRLSSERVRKKLEHIEHSGVDVSYKFAPEGFKDLDEFILRGGNMQEFGLERTVIDQ